MEMKSKKQWWVSILVCCCLMAIPGQSHASLVIEGAGTYTTEKNETRSISAQASFDLVDYDFGSGSTTNAIKITLTNTSLTTTDRGDLLTGLFWSMNGVGALPTDAAGFDGLAPYGGTRLKDDDIAPAYKGSDLYMLANRSTQDWIANDGLDYNVYAYGISTVSMGLDGFNGSLTGDDGYGIAAPGSDLTQGGLQSIPIIDGTAIFYIDIPENIEDLQITNAAFGFGSKPNHRVEAAAVPIPPTVLIFGSGLLGVFGVRRRLGRIS